MQVILPSNQLQPLISNKEVNSAASALKQEQQLRVEQEKKEQQKPQQQSRFDVSDDAIAAVEEALANNTQLSTPLAERNTSNKNQNGNVQKEYDQPSEQNLSAVATYQSVGNIAQRESVKDVFGVDLFA